MEAEKSKKIWYSVTVTADVLAEAAVDTAFGILDSNGTEIDSLGKTDTGEIRVTGYFDDRPDSAGVEKAINESLINFGLSRDAVQKIEYDAVQEKDWLQEWKKHWKPTEVGSFVITPPWEKVAAGGNKIVISIEPSMAFGTGTHETTRLCLGLIEKHYRSPMSFLDVGTGTGILSIAAARFGGESESGKICACDVDEDSVKIARENAVSNGVSEIVFEIGTVGPDTPEFDFVCANLTIDVILPILPLLLEKTKRVLVLSGILAEQENTLVSELRSFGEGSFSMVHEGEWIAAAVHKS